MHDALGHRRPDTVFFGGGTPSLIAPADIAPHRRRARSAARRGDHLEANPERSTIASRPLAPRASRASRSACRARAPTCWRRSSAPTRPAPPSAAARAARAAGFAHVSLDLIYGTPGETDADWRASLDAALAAGPDHVSAYALTVEPGTRLAAQVREGLVPAPDEDALARRYELADDTLTAAGLQWYEISNWARDDDARCRHNLDYWSRRRLVGDRARRPRPRRPDALLDAPPPRPHAAAVAAGELPIAGHEVLSDEPARAGAHDAGTAHPRGPAGRGVRSGQGGPLLADGLLRREGARVVLTLRGRRLADGVVRALASAR